MKYSSMKILAKTGFASLLVLLAAPAAAQQKPASAEDVAAAIDACAKISTPTWLHLKQLPSHGWDYAERRGNGRSKQVVKGVYESKGNNAIIVIGKEELEAKNCVVNARLYDTSSYSTLLQDLSGIIGMPTRQDGFTYFWTMSDHTVRVDPAGERDRPLARFELHSTKAADAAAEPAAETPQESAE